MATANGGMSQTVVDAGTGERQIKVTTLERGYLNAGIATLIAQRKRGRANMVEGSEMYRYATAEIASLEAIKEKLA